MRATHDSGLIAVRQHDEKRRFRHLWTLAMLMALALVRPVGAQTTASVLEPRGFQPNRAYFTEAPYEYIDMMSGALILAHTDLVLPGNAGWDLRFQRTFNSKRSYGWTFGIEDLPLYVSFNGSGPPMFELADGGRRTLHPTSSGYWLSRDFWRYYPAARRLLQPNGRWCAYDDPGTGTLRVTSCFDQFGNRVAFEWTATPTPRLVVTQFLGLGQTRRVTLDLESNSVLFPTRMEFLGRVWQYTSVPSPGGGLLSRVDAPEGVVWRYAYAGAIGLTVTSPYGGVVSYTFDTETWVTRDPRDGTTTEHITWVVRDRQTSGRGIAQGLWHYDYTFLDGSQDSFSGSSTLETPSARHTYTHVDAGTFLPPGTLLETEPVLTERRVQAQRGNGNNIDDVEVESRSYQGLPLVQSSRIPAVRTRTITRAGLSAPLATTYQYDLSGPDLADYHHPAAIIEAGTAGTRTTRRAYTHLTDPNGPYVVGLPARETVDVNGEESFTKAWAYDSATGFRTSETRFGISTEFTNDGVGNVASATTPAGSVTGFTYEWGLLKNTSTAAHVTTREINPDGTVRSQTQARRTTTFTYDNLSRLRQVQPPGGTNPVLTTYATDGASVTVQRGGSIVTTTLDGVGRPIGTVNSVGVRTESQYDAEGRVTFESSPFTGARVGIATTYDALGRPTSRTHSDGTGIDLAYAADRVTLRDEARRTTVQTVAAFGDPDKLRIVGLADANGQTWQYTYDALDQLRSVAMPGGTSRTWEYVPGTDRLLRETHPESGSITSAYDPGGRLQQRTDARGTTFTYSYDGNDRVRAITAGAQTTTFTYEPGSDLRQSAVVNGVATTFQYNGAGQLAGRIDQLEGNPFVTAFSYDGDDNLTGIDYPSRSGSSRRLVTIDYDAEHRPIAVRDGTRSYANNVQYHPSGSVTAFQSGNGLLNTFGYDPQRYWPTSVGVSVGPTPWTLTYQQYDGVGNVGRITDSRGAGFRQDFGYDRLDRLTQASGSYGAAQFAYDAHGNRQTSGGTTYAYDAATLRLLQQGPSAFAYDNNGNQTSDGVRTFTLTPDNMVATVTNGAATTRYAYDADQWRVKKETPNQPPTYTIRGPRGDLLTEWRTNGTTAQVTDYVSLGSRLVAKVARDYPEPPPVSACIAVIDYNFAATSAPLYPTDSPGGPSRSLPNYWQTPVWPYPIASEWGPPLATFPDLMIAESANIVGGQLRYTPNESVFTAAVFGHADPTGLYRTLPLFSVYNNGRTVFAEADVDFTTEVYNAGDLNYVRVFSIYGPGLSWTDLLAVGTPPSGPVQFMLDYRDPTSFRGIQRELLHTRDAGSVIGQTHRVRLELKPSTPANPSDPFDFTVNADAVIRLYIDGALVYENTTASLVLSYGGSTLSPNYDVGAVSVGFYGVPGAYNTLRLGYCAAGN